jgi:uncharacterized membrane protein YgdD (TMEM256/DUF423 family)
MKEFLLTFGGIFGGLSVLLGAFGAHALKKKLNTDLLKSFETGVQYQMYHALILIISGLMFPFIETSQIVMGWCFILGIFFFSFSIYALCFISLKGKNLKLLALVTPVGGLLLLVGWILFTVNAAIIAEYL